MEPLALARDKPPVRCPQIALTCRLGTGQVYVLFYASAFLEAKVEKRYPKRR